MQGRGYGIPSLSRRALCVRLEQASGSHGGKWTHCTELCATGAAVTIADRMRQFTRQCNVLMQDILGIVSINLHNTCIVST